MKLFNIIGIIIALTAMLACGKNMATFAGEERTLDQRSKLTSSMDAEGIPLVTPDPVATQEPIVTPEVPKTFADTKLFCEKVVENPLTYGCVLRYNDGTKYEGVISKWISLLLVEEQQSQGTIEITDAPKDSAYYVYVKPGPSITLLKFEITSAEQPNKPRALQVPIENNNDSNIAEANNSVTPMLNGEHFIHLSLAGQSCTEACADHGGYNEATNTMIGSNGDSLLCGAAFILLNGKMTVNSDNTCSVGIGCYLGADSSQKRCKATKTTEDAFLAGVKRVCLCNAE